MPQHAQTKGIHQWVTLIRLIEINFARDCRDAEAIAVMGNARHDAAEETAIVDDR